MTHSYNFKNNNHTVEALLWVPHRSSLLAPSPLVLTRQENLGEVHLCLLDIQSHTHLSSGMSFYNTPLCLLNYQNQDIERAWVRRGFLVCLSHVSGSHLWLESWMRFFFFVSHLHFRLFHVTLEQRISFSIVILWKSVDLFLFTKKYPQSPVVALVLFGWVYHSFFPLSTLPLWVPADKEVVERVVPADRN